MEDISALQEFNSNKESNIKASGSSLGKEDFLKLLVTQLESQDPLDPSDPTEFTAQLAQFSSLEQLNNISDGMESLESVSSGFQRLSALSLIGKNVVSENSSFTYRGEPVEVGCRFDEAVKTARIRIRNERGQIVDELNVNPSSDGEALVQWGGPGGTAGSGSREFTVEAVGISAGGEEINGTPLVSSLVTGVDFLDSGSMLVTAGGKISFSDVSAVNNPTLSAAEQRP